LSSTTLRVGTTRRLHRRAACVPPASCRACSRTCPASAYGDESPTCARGFIRLKPRPPRRTTSRSAGGSGRSCGAFIAGSSPADSLAGLQVGFHQQRPECIYPDLRVSPSLHSYKYSLLLLWPYRYQVDPRRRSYGSLQYLRKELCANFVPCIRLSFDSRSDQYWPNILRGAPSLILPEVS